MELQHLSTYMFLHCHGLGCLVYCCEWLCQFALVDSIMWVRNLHECCYYYYCDYHHHHPEFTASWFSKSVADQALTHILLVILKLFSMC